MLYNETSLNKLAHQRKPSPPLYRTVSDCFSGLSRCSTPVPYRTSGEFLLLSRRLWSELLLTRCERETRDQSADHHLRRECILKFSQSHSEAAAVWFTQIEWVFCYVTAIIVWNSPSVLPQTVFLLLNRSRTANLISFAATQHQPQGRHFVLERTHTHKRLQDWCRLNVNKIEQFHSFLWAATEPRTHRFWVRSGIKPFAVNGYKCAGFSPAFLIYFYWFN